MPVLDVASAKSILQISSLLIQAVAACSVVVKWNYERKKWIPMANVESCSREGGQQGAEDRATAKKNRLKQRDPDGWYNTLEIKTLACPARKK